MFTEKWFTCKNYYLCLKIMVDLICICLILTLIEPTNNLKVSIWLHRLFANDYLFYWIICLFSLGFSIEFDWVGWSVGRSVSRSVSIKQTMFACVWFELIGCSLPCNFLSVSDFCWTDGTFVFELIKMELHCRISGAGKFLVASQYIENCWTHFENE